MRILLLGGPGAGKGTHAKVLTIRLNIPHISTGDIFRENIKKSTELGERVKNILKEGKLVPDDLTNDIAKDRLQKDDCRNGFILDGYPRTIYQAEFLDDFLDSIHQKLDYVINIDASEECIINRMSKRRSCPACGRVYHLINIPPKKDGQCDACGGKLVQREDDKVETVKDRLNIYYKYTKPLIEYYSNKGTLETLDGERKGEVVLQDILNIIGEQ